MDKRYYNSQEALAYLGIKRKAFEKHFRPFLSSVRFGVCVTYDRIDLDRIWEDYQSRNGRPVEKGEHVWADNKAASTVTSKAGGVSIRSTAALDFETVLKSMKKQKTG